MRTITDILSDERFEALVDVICLGFIATETDGGELGVDQARVDLAHPDGRVHQLIRQRFGDGIHRVL